MGAAWSCIDRDHGRDRGRECCDATSLFGEDAFYRDNFYDCEGGDASQDHLFARIKPLNSVREQARLKYRKTKTFTSYAGFAAKKELCACTPQARKLDGSPSHSRSLLSRQHSKEKFEGLSVARGQTTDFIGVMPEWTGKQSPDCSEGPFWQKGSGTGIMVRSGPNYKQNKLKAPSSWAMYEALCLDSLKHQSKLDSVIGNIVPEDRLPEIKRRTASACSADHGGGRPLEWSPGCPLPRLICINLMLPYSAGLTPWSKDDGCSVIGFFEITPEALHHLRSMEKAPPCVRLFKEFLEGPAGKPGGPLDDPDRCLDRRLLKGKKKDEQGGLLKAVAYCQNPQDVSIPEAFTKFNGKPCLITKSGYIVKDPNNEWIELGIDVRGFCLLARKCLQSFRGMLPKARLHYGFWIQATEDEDLPEALLCDVYCHGFNIDSDPIPYEAE